MLKAHRVTADNLSDIQAIYEAFAAVAKSDYRWVHDAIAFGVLARAFSTGRLGGYWVEDTALGTQIALMLYIREEHRAIEINLLYIAPDPSRDDVNRKGILDCVMRALLKDLKADPQLLDTFDVISFAMMGEQEKFIRSILWYGFRARGQAIVKFDIMDPIGLQILQKQTFKPLPENYRIVPWGDQYSGGVANVIFQSFQHASDAYWDPRFRSETGARKVVSMIRQGALGKLCEEATSILLKDGVPVGVCYLVQDTATEGNIPLVGVLPEEKKHDFGNHLLQQTLIKTIQGMLDGKMAMLAINATHDTDNIAAIKMYRRMGFREDYNYPHVYLTTEKLRAIQPGKWC